MIVYRLSKSVYALDLTGKGAERTGGRWNSKGVPMIYTSSSRALSTAEIAVHIPLGMVPVDYMLITIDIPDKYKVEDINLSLLVEKWNAFPYSGTTRAFGDAFIKAKRSLVLRVPSAVVQGDYNYLINPHHPGIKDVKIVKVEPFSFDNRLFLK